MQLTSKLTLGAALTVMGAMPAFGQSRIELPLNADNCAIHMALSPETSGNCLAISNGAGRGIVLRLNDALEDTNTLPLTGSVQSILQRPIAPTVRVAAATPNVPIKNDATPTESSHAAAESKDGYFVQFAFDSASLEPQFQAHLNRLSDVLKVQAMATSCIKIIGHTDTVGDAGYNLKLSDSRANTVALYLKEKRGIPSSRVETEAAGETRPLSDVKGDDALNRRVEFATKEAVDGC